MVDLVKVVTTSRPNEISRDTVVTTPMDMPNVKIVAMNAALRVLVRVFRTYFQSVLGLLTLAAIAPVTPVLSDVLPPAQLGEVIVFALLGGLGPAFYSLIQNVAELLAKVDESLPELRG
jgi:hypothetical protein